LAVASYHETHGQYPPPFTTDENGTRLHSWRVLILPFLGETELYEKINLDEPWNSSANRKLAVQMPVFYAFHGEYEPGLTKTNYLAVVGSETVWPPEGVRNSSELKDGNSSTILVVENSGSGIGWMEPFDLAYSTMNFDVPHPNGVSSKYSDSAVVMADGILLSLTEEFPPDVLQAMLTIDGGEELREERRAWSVLADGRDRESK